MSSGRPARLLLPLLAALTLTFVPATAYAEGTIYYGGYGINMQGCGSGILPCRTYDFARQQACTASTSNGDVFHVIHVVDGYVSSCDMTALSGREPGVFQRSWTGFFQSTIFPSVFVLCVVLGSGALWISRED